VWSVQSKLVENFCGDWSDRRKFRTRTVEIVWSHFRAMRVKTVGVMSAYGPERTSQVAPHMSAFGGKADNTFCSASVCF